MGHHFGGTSSDVKKCKQCPEDLRDKFLQIHTLRQQSKATNDENVNFDDGAMDAFVEKKSGAKQITINRMVKDRDPVIRDIFRFFYGHALLFNLVKSALFHRMLKSVGKYGKGLKPPSYHEARVTYLKKEVDLVTQGLETYKKEWVKTRCTLMSDAWSDGKRRSITNFLVNSPKGSVFLQSIDTSAFIKNSNAMFELLDKIVEEIGEENVVQVVTDSASNFVGAGELLEMKRKKLVWNLCTAHLIDLMLKDIGEIPVYYDTLEKAKQVAIFIYGSTCLLSMFRKFTKLRELAKPGVIRFATSYLTLKSFHDRKIQMRAMFASDEWDTSSYATTAAGKQAQKTIMDDNRFWNSIKYCMSSTLPLVKVLRLVDGDAKPAMGYNYEAMDRAKEEIAKKFDNVKTRYQRVLDIVDTRWNLQLHRPIHAAGYFLNPRFQYDPSFKADMEVKSGLYKTIEKM